MSRKTESSVARDLADRRQDVNNPLPTMVETLAAIREAQLSAAETVRAEAVRFLECCLVWPEDVAMRAIEDVVAGRKKEF